MQMKRATLNNYCLVAEVEHLVTLYSYEDTML